MDSSDFKLDKWLSSSADVFELFVPFKKPGFD
jgi:hypothetical protein